MANSPDTYDAIVVGASLAGCTTAILLARAGASVLLVEQRAELDAYKTVCGHYIHASAHPAIERLGLFEPMMQAGAVRSPIRFWFDDTVIEPVPAERVPPPINLPRKYLDPLLRGLAAETTGVELRLGTGLREIAAVAEDAVRVRLTSGDVASARLLVGADGRNSTVAKLIGARTITFRNGRFNYSPFFAGPSYPGAPATTSYFIDDQWFGAFPTADGLTGYYLMPTHDRLPEYKRDLEGACRAAIAALPEAPPVEELELAGPIVGRLDISAQRRAPIRDRIALVGDAALAADPLYGVGCGWAFQMGEMLADAVAEPLLAGAPMARPLRQYRRSLNSALLPHLGQMLGYSRGRALNPMERFAMRRAARDERVAERVIRLTTRTISPLRLTLDPAEIALLLRA